MKKIIGVLVLSVLILAKVYAATVTTAVWTEDVEFHSSASLSAGAVASDNIDINTAGYDSLSVTVQITFGASPDDATEIGWYASNDSGTSIDNIALSSVTVTEVTSSVQRITINVANLPFVTFRVRNNDSTDSVTYEGWYSGRKWSSE